MKRNEPYVGIFNKRDPEKEVNVAKGIDEICDVGVFAQVHEVQDLGDRIRLVATAHRRIRLKKQIRPDVPLKGSGKRKKFFSIFLLLRN